MTRLTWKRCNISTAQNDVAELYQITAALEAAYKVGTGAPLLVVLVGSNNLPQNCAPMPRIPAPASGAALDKDFPQAYQNALRVNPEVHDGAVIAGREAPEQGYRVLGWSFRLFPTTLVTSTLPNRGSAFHSGQAMSAEPNIEVVFLLARDEIVTFCNGEVDSVRPLVVGSATKSRTS